jgi:hypothetical protein
MLWNRIAQATLADLGARAAAKPTLAVGHVCATG